jgi:outer membrane protein assembly factor BamB
MYRIALFFLFALGMVAAEPIAVSATDWPWWRGPTRNGIAPAGQSPPTTWSPTKNVRWKTPIPGRSHGSATVVGKQVFLTTADAARQSVFCFDRESGAVCWQTVVHDGGITEKANKKATQASTSVACDGKRLFATFLNDGAVYASALDLSGKLLWQTQVSRYVLHQGYASSPAVWESLVIVGADNKSGGAVAGLERASGKIVWKQSRPKLPSYTSPVILEVAGRNQLFFTGCMLISSFDPLTGEKLWEIAGATEECVTTTVTDGRHIYSSGGWPRNHMAAIRADGSGEIAWQNSMRVYVPSMLVRDGYLYAVADAGIALCYKADSGEEIWKARIKGTFSSSPVLVGDHIYVTNESGKSYIYSADPKGFDLLATNQLGDEVFATPAICGDRIFQRVAEGRGEERQEYLYCLGE